jgi:hypothetical protein
MNKPMKTPHAIVSISYPVVGPVADIVLRAGELGAGDRSRRLRDLLVMGEQYPATVKSLEADVRDAEIQLKKWVRIAHRADHMNGHADLGHTPDCPLCRALEGDF